MFNNLPRAEDSRIFGSVGEVCEPLSAAAYETEASVLVIGSRSIQD
jgi:hypothetical protein